MTRGFLVGAATGVILGLLSSGGGSTDDNYLRFEFSDKDSILLSGMIFGVLGFLTGAIVGEAKKKYKTIYTKTNSSHQLDEILKKINKKARYPN